MSAPNIVCIVLLILRGVSGHGAVVEPAARNNIDHQEQPWAGPVPQPVPPVDDGHQGFWCPVPGYNNSLSGHLISYMY